jgi:chromosome segregation ATPase
MSHEITRNLDGDRPFEERVFGRFDGIEEYLRSLDSRVQALASRGYDTKPIWERALKEILETRLELKETRDELKGEVKEIRVEVKETRVELKDLRYDLNTFKRDVTARLDEIQMIVLENRVVVRRAHERIDDLESKPV